MGVISFDDDRMTKLCMKQLGLEAGFDQKQLKAAYLKGSLKLSPDRGGDANKFIALQKAHAHLIPLARRAEVNLNAPLPERPARASLVADGGKSGPRFKSVDDAFSTIHGDVSETIKRGHGEYLKKEVRPELRPPDKISPAHINTVFEKVSRAREPAPSTVSTHVVSPMEAQSTVAYPIYDDADDFGDGRSLADLQAAYGST